MAVVADGGMIQYENANALRSYPFEENEVLVSADGRTLPDSAIVDLRMVVPSSATGSQSGIENDDFHVELASFHVSRDMVSACVRVIRDGEVAAALSATVSADRFSPYMPARMEKLAGTYDAGGIITFGDIEFPFSPETYFFSGVRFHPACITAFHPPKLRSFFDPRSDNRVSGDAEIEFSAYVVASKSGRSFRLSLEDGAEDELMSSCAKNLPINGCGAEPIMAINGVQPDAQDRIVLWFH